MQQVPMTAREYSKFIENMAERIAQGQIDKKELEELRHRLRPEPPPKPLPPTAWEKRFDRTLELTPSVLKITESLFPVWTQLAVLGAKTTWFTAKLTGKITLAFMGTYVVGEIASNAVHAAEAAANTANMGVKIVAALAFGAAVLKGVQFLTNTPKNHSNELVSKASNLAKTYLPTLENGYATKEELEIPTFQRPPPVYIPPSKQEKSEQTTTESPQRNNTDLRPSGRGFRAQEEDEEEQAMAAFLQQLLQQPARH